MDYRGRVLGDELSRGGQLTVVVVAHGVGQGGLRGGVSHVRGDAQLVVGLGSRSRFVDTSVAASVSVVAAAARC